MSGSDSCLRDLSGAVTSGRSRGRRHRHFLLIPSLTVAVEA
ncbi:hypothetical protein ACFQ3B_26110 [Stackebrandtia endophytica]|nr:hypothetical protein [Stackebrandtia endophytica]